jgi:uncharacterized membrane protein
MLIWIVMLIISYVFLFLAQFLKDMTSIFWMGLLGSGIGTFLTFIAECAFGRKKKHEIEDEIGKDSDKDE